MAENVLDLGGVFDDAQTMTVIDKPNKRKWLVDLDLPGSTLHIFFQDSDDWARGRLTEEQEVRMYQALHGIMRRNQACTLDEVREAFSVGDVTKIVQMLFGLLASSQSQEDGEGASTRTPNRAQRRKKTPSTSAPPRAASASA